MVGGIDAEIAASTGSGSIVINADGDGVDDEIVAAVAGQVVILSSYVLVANGEATVTWKSGNTAISGDMVIQDGKALVVNVPLVTELGEALNLAVDGGTAAITVNGYAWYAQVRGGHSS